MRKMTIGAFALAVAAVDVAQAQPTTPAQPPKPAQNSADERAFTLYEQGRAAFREGRYKEAVVLLLESQRLKPEPVLDFNIGKAYEALGESAKAITHYEAFLKNVADVPDRPEIEAKLAQLKHSLAPKQEVGPVANPVVAPPSVDPVGDGPSPVPWFVAGLGLAGLGVGAGLGAAASSTNDDVANAANQVEGSELRDSAESLALGANIAFGLGGAVLAAGVIWGIVDVTSASSTEQPPAVTARVGPTWASVEIKFD